MENTLELLMLVRNNAPLELVEKLIVNSKNKEQIRIDFIPQHDIYSAIHWVCYHRNLAVMKLLVHHFPSPWNGKLRCNTLQQTPLLAFLFNDFNDEDPDREMLEFIINKCPGTNFKDKAAVPELNALQMAARGGFTKTVRFFLAQRNVRFQYEDFFAFRTNIYPLRDEYIEDHEKTRHELRLLYGIGKEEDSAITFSLLCLVSEEYLRVPESKRFKFPPLKARRFFKILLKLPVELQMMTVNYLQGLNKPFIKNSLIQTELFRLVQKEK